MPRHNAPRATLTRHTSRVICLACKQQAVALLTRHDELVYRFAREHFADHDADDFPHLPNAIYNWWRQRRKEIMGKLNLNQILQEFKDDPLAQKLIYIVEVEDMEEKRRTDSDTPEAYAVYEAPTLTGVIVFGYSAGHWYVNPSLRWLVKHFVERTRAAQNIEKVKQAQKAIRNGGLVSLNINGDGSKLASKITVRTGKETKINVATVNGWQRLDLNGSNWDLVICRHS